MIGNLDSRIRLKIPTLILSLLQVAKIEKIKARELAQKIG